MTKVTAATRQQKLDELWRRGVLAPWLLHETQKKMYADIQASSHKKYVINSSRRLGKSFLLSTIAIEYAIKNPNAQIKFAAPSQKMVRKILIPLFRQVLQSCPKALRPKLKTFDGVFEFPNGSEIHIAGSELAQADNLRGTSCDLAIIDEAGFCSDLEYLVESVLMPQTLTRPNARIIMASTPPPESDHPFTRYAARAQEQGAYAKYTIYDNPMLTRTQIEEYQDEAGGATSITWRREYLAEFLTDASMALFPEATEERIKQIVTEVDRPPFLIPITAIDLGYIDHTGVVFAYYDFPRGKIVILDELLMNKSTSAEIVTAVTAKEKELFGNIPVSNRVIDAPPLTIADLNATHRFSCHAPQKGDLHANVNRVRIDLEANTFIIHPRCRQLITQIQFATWDKTKTKFSRTSSGGHWDLAAAMIYLAKHADRRTNPAPPGYGWDTYNSWGVPRQHQNETRNVMARMFPFIAGRRQS
jgi:hypothetical protein